jgi:hypothetical protein
VAWPGRTRIFGLSSGTTSGEKYLPLTAAALRTNRGGAFDNLAPYLAVSAERLLGGRLVVLSGSTTLTREGAVRVGDNTGVMAGRIGWLLRRRWSPGPEIAAIPDGAVRLERTVEAARGQDVRMLAGLPSWLTVFAQGVLAGAVPAGTRARCGTCGRAWGSWCTGARRSPPTASA